MLGIASRRASTVARDRVPLPTTISENEYVARSSLTFSARVSGDIMSRCSSWILSCSSRRTRATPHLSRPGSTAKMVFSPNIGVITILANLFLALWVRDGVYG